MVDPSSCDPGVALKVATGVFFSGSSIFGACRVVSDDCMVLKKWEEHGAGSPVSKEVLQCFFIESKMCFYIASVQRLGFPHPGG